MLPKSELKVFASKINLDLFNEVTNFILETAKAPYSQIRELYERCFLRTAEPMSETIQTKYGFLYLGELLERYEERFGMPDADLRAIALALGFASGLLTPNMFVGNQKYVFFNKVKAEAEDDVYLAGALCLLGEDTPKWENFLMEREYNLTEEIIFVMCVLSDFQASFSHFKPQLLRLLGKERNFPVLGNTKPLDWFIAQLTPALKKCRGKDISLFRTLCALPKSYVKPGSKEYKELAANGYTPLEIAYINMMCVQSQLAGNALNPSSIVTTKIAVQLFQEVVFQEEPFTAEMYDWLGRLYSQYQKFPKLCYGTHYLINAIEERAILRNADTFCWLANLAGLQYSIFECFDILNSKWDKLAETLDHQKYRRLLQENLSDKMAKEEILARIARYDALTGASYVKECLGTARYGMELLVEKGIIDLWDVFCGCLDENRDIVNEDTLHIIIYYVTYHFNPQTFCFLDRFFSQYGMSGLEKYFGYEHKQLFRDMYEVNGRHSFKLTVCRNFLDEERNKTLLGWVQDYVFTYKPEFYLDFALALLIDENTSDLLEPSEQRVLFDLLIEQKELVGYHEQFLKQRYLNADELKADQEAAIAAQREMERQAQIERKREISGRFLQVEKTFPNIYQFLDRFYYPRQDIQIACTVVREQLESLLATACYCLDSQGLAGFLKVCGKLLEQGVLELPQAQEYIKMLKEDVTNDTECDKAC